MSKHTPEIGNHRLLQLATLLDSADAAHVARNEPLYDQGSFIHPCGTPACALGHWAAANPQSWAFSASGVPVGLTNGSHWNQAAIDFHIASHEHEDLFGPLGCGSALTAKAAASYIREFVAARARLVSA